MPPQYKPQPLYDFRQFPDETRGFKVGVTKWGKVGTKRKLDDYAEQVRRSAAWSVGGAALVGLPVPVHSQSLILATSR